MAADNNAKSTSVLGQLLAGTPAQPKTTNDTPVIPPPGEYRLEGYGSIPLENYQQIVRYKNGCGRLVNDGEVVGSASGSMVEQSSWFGACRFGLIHGKGYERYEGQYSNGQYTPLSASYGRANRSPTNFGAYTVSRGEGRASQIEMREIEPPKKEVLQPGGRMEMAILAYETVTDDQVQVTSSVWMAKYLCPTPQFGSMEDVMPDHAKLLPKESYSALLKSCKAADSRMKSENRNKYFSDIFASPYDDVAYGHYYEVYRMEVRSLRRGHIYSTDYKDGWSSRTFDVKLCPQISSPAECESVWQPMIVDYAQRIEKLRQEFPAAEETDRNLWNARFAPWEEAARAKIVAFLAKGGGQ